MCTILYDVIKTVLLSLLAWHTRLFTDSIHNIRWVLHRGNWQRMRLCNCLLTLCACSRATAVILRARFRIQDSRIFKNFIGLTMKEACLTNSYCACATGKGRVDKGGKCLEKPEFLNFLAVFWISHHWSNSCTFSAGNMLRKKFQPTRLFLRNFGLSCANCAVRTTKFIPASKKISNDLEIMHRPHSEFSNQIWMIMFFFFYWNQSWVPDSMTNRNANQWKWWIVADWILGHQIVWKFFTWHDSCAVMPSAKFSNNRCVVIWIKVESQMWFLSSNWYDTWRILRETGSRSTTKIMTLSVLEIPVWRPKISDQHNDFLCRDLGPGLLIKEFIWDRTWISNYIQ